MEDWYWMIREMSRITTLVSDAVEYFHMIQIYRICEYMYHVKNNSLHNMKSSKLGNKDPCRITHFPKNERL